MLLGIKFAPALSLLVSSPLLLAIGSSKTSKGITEGFIFPIQSSSGCGTRTTVQFNSVSSLSSTSTLNLPTTECVGITCEDISVVVEIDDESNSNWSADAAEKLSNYGVCALIPSPSTQLNNNTGLISQSLCEAVDEVISDHLYTLHSKIENRGIDPTGVEDGPYRFREVVCRDGSPRFDVPIPWSGAGRRDEEEEDDLYELRDFTGIEDNSACKTIQDFHQHVDDVVQSVVNSLWDSSKANNNKDHSGCCGCGRATSAGFLVNKPGSTTQAWHRDGPDEGYINAFVPLVDLDESLGPTSILPLSHVMPNNIRLNNNDNNTDNSSSNDDTPLLPIIPTLKKGQILLFDYRTLHKGLGNTNAEGISRTLAYVVYTRGSITDVHNFPDALTLEYD